MKQKLTLRAVVDDAINSQLISLRTFPFVYKKHTQQPEGPASNLEPKILRQREYRKQFDIDGKGWLYFLLAYFSAVLYSNDIPRSVISFALDSIYLSNRRRVHWPY